MSRQITEKELELIFGAGSNDILENIYGLPFIDNVMGAVYGAVMGTFVGGVGGGYAGSYVSGGILGVVGGSLGYLSTTVVGGISGGITGFFRGYKQMETLLPTDVAWKSIIALIAGDRTYSNPIVTG